MKLAGIVLLAKNPSKLPILPDTLVGLTGLSALAFVTAKTVSSQRPTITSIVAAQPGPAGTAITAGTHLEIRGANFEVPGADDTQHREQVQVRFDTTVVSPGAANVEAKKITVMVPNTVSAGSVQVAVVTATGAESEEKTLDVAPSGDGPAPPGP